VSHKVECTVYNIHLSIHRITNSAKTAMTLHKH